ncbi:MAG: cysteine--tRNA ligase, partial [Chloroflexi bacterium CFX6]|nr:cysteine--tRNA ligase [Chloroflexi bacterium CFX6]
MAIQIYNTLTRRKEPLETLEPGVVRLYVCGVTVYAGAHIGHAMSYLVFDAVRRYLEHRGYRVRHVQNFTDVDDKIIARSQAEGVSAFEIADRYAREFLIELDRLGILPAHIYPRVSSEMPAIVDMIRRLVDQESAYAPGNGDVYFDSASAPGYGRLSGRSLDEAQAQEAPSPFKRAAVDFALWKAAKPGEPAWDSPWGPGRPGWHIECSAMAARHLGDQIDIHGGGTDLIFPHHENEIAQSEAACGCRPFARFWMHNGLLQIGDEKMSKSLGNIVGIRDFLRAHEPEALRLFVLSSHYRKPVTLSDESIAAAEKGLERLRGALRPALPGAP